MELARAADGRNTIWIKHRHSPRAVWFDEGAGKWRELTRHISEVRHAR